MSASNSKSALLIAGPTASGKSALAVQLAQKCRGVIINADALQVYRELRILTARPTADDEAAAPHRLYGQVSGADAYSVARWLADAKIEIERCWSNGQLPIICGGTGLYFKALKQGLAEVPEIPAQLREHWRKYSGDLHAELRVRDEAGAARLNPADRQRIIRALEVIEATGQPLSWWQAQGSENAVLKGVAVEYRFLDVPRDELYARAARRFDQMLEQGVLDEVKALVPLDPALPVMKAIGVPELLAHLRGGMTLDDATVAAKTATRNYIKRQLTWWRGQMSKWQELTP